MRERAGHASRSQERRGEDQAPCPAQCVLRDREGHGRRPAGPNVIRPAELYAESRHVVVVGGGGGGGGGGRRSRLLCFYYGTRLYVQTRLQLK